MKSLLFALFMLPGLALAAPGAEIAGVKFEDTARVGDADLTLNGVGLRSRFLVKVYAMALYLAERQGNADAVLQHKGGKRVRMVLVRDITARQLVDALNEGVVKNAAPAELEAIKQRLAEFANAMLEVGEAKSGTTVLLDYLPGKGTRVLVGGQQRGRDIPGEDFYRALLKVWLGDKPVQDDLKAALLGKE